METKIVPLSKNSLLLPPRIIDQRTISNSSWIDKHASGTLSTNKELGFVYSIQCLSERIAYVFGYGFCPVKMHLLAFNDAITECDDVAYTLSGRLVKSYLAKSLFDEDIFELKYISISNEETGKTKWEGLGLIVKETSAEFIPAKTLVVAKICQFNSKKQMWSNVVNFS